MNALTVVEARATLARHAKTFRLASWFLPASTRDDAAVVYAFCRAVDDEADEVGDPIALAGIRRELEGANAPRPAVAAFLEVAAAREVPVSAALELVEGCASDLDRVRIADEEALLRYAYLVAGTVGRMMAPLLGTRDPRAVRHAVDLGIAMQLTNIARDVAEDAGRGRVYLPATWLSEAGVAQEDVARGTADPQRVFAIVRRLVERAEPLYRSGERGLAYLPWRARIAIGVAARVYRAIGLAVVRRGPDALADRTVLSTAERALRAFGGVAVAVRARAEAA